jgi:hypothetical protein
MAALTLAGSAAVAAPASVATAPGTQAAMPVGSGKACAHSTNSIRQLALIDKADDVDFQCLGVSLDHGAIKTIRLETHSFVATDQQPDQEQIKIEEFPQAVIESSRGAVLDGVPGHDAIVLRGQFATVPGKLALVASFLYNGFTGDYHSCPVTLYRGPDIGGSDVGWRLVDRFDQTVSHIVVRTRKIPLIGVFGIANLDGACP